jgi:hypothetical protein
MPWASAEQEDKMRKINYEWVKEQFAHAKVRVGTGKAVLKMLKTWEEIEMDQAQSKETLDILAKVGLGHALIEINKDEVWAPAQRGQIKVGDIVRVAHDAFSDSTGHIHNGRLGIVVAVRSGDIIFKSTDLKEPFLDGVHYSPEKLEKRLR